MCLLFFAYKMTPGCQLLLAANRDEFLERPTAPLDYLDPAKNTLGGRDLQAGGTWLGVTRSGRIAALTNYRQGGTNRTDVVSRGKIVSDFLSYDISPLEFTRNLEKHGHRYNGFNLVCGDRDQLIYYSNKGPPPQVLAPGYYGLSNSLLDVPWPKVARGKVILREHMLRQYSRDAASRRPLAIVNVMQDQWRPEDAHLPDTGVGLSWERILSAIFIRTAGYGTRSTAVIFKMDAEVIFHEATHLHEIDESAELSWRSVAMALTG